MTQMDLKTTESLLGLCDSSGRGTVLGAALVSNLTKDEKRKLVKDWWTVCEAWDRSEIDRVLMMLAQLDPPLGDPLPDGNIFDIYRATGGETPDGGSWTLDVEVAKMFAKMITSPRGQILGMTASEEPTVWAARVDRGEVLAYFTDREESELVIPHGAAAEIEPRYVLAPA